MSSSSKCPFQYIFGTPGQGVHHLRIFGLAAFDLGLTAAVALALAFCFRGSSQVNVAVQFVVYFLLLMIIAMFIHRIFCVKTPLNGFLF